MVRLTLTKEERHLKYALANLTEAHQNLIKSGWKDIMYCPKDKTFFLSIEFGSSGIHKTYYDPDTKSCWISSCGDLWPSNPIVFKPIIQ